VKRARKKRNGTLLSERARNPLKFKTEKEFEAWKAKAHTGPPRKRKPAKRGVRGTVRALGKSIVRGLGMAHNPSRHKKKPGPRSRKIMASHYRAGHLERAGSPGSLKKLYKQHKRSFRNPSPASVFSEFRGRPVRKQERGFGPNGTPRTVAVLGRLVELHVRGKKLTGFPRNAQLVASGSKRLYIANVQTRESQFTPGDQGEILSVVYEADKPKVQAASGDSPTKKFQYRHHFGEDGGRLPHLVIDDEGCPRIEGGSYKIDADGIID
jgi:hypothetical protein